MGQEAEIPQREAFMLQLLGREWGIERALEDADVIDLGNDVRLTQSIPGRMLGYGTLEIITASESGINRLEYLPRPMDFKKAMMAAAQASASARGIRSILDGSVSTLPADGGVVGERDVRDGHRAGVDEERSAGAHSSPSGAPAVSALRAAVGDVEDLQIHRLARGIDKKDPVQIVPADECVGSGRPIDRHSRGNDGQPALNRDGAGHGNLDR